MSAHRILGAVDLITFQFRSRWEKIQISFVDEPRQSDHQSVLSRCSLANVRSWKPSWDKNDNVATEDLRLSLRLYRSFFGRLLSAWDQSIRAPLSRRFLQMAVWAAVSIEARQSLALRHGNLVSLRFRPPCTGRRAKSLSYGSQ